MVCSISLLMVLQFFWLRASYEKAFGDLRKDTNILLRNTIAEMRDSLLLRNLKPIHQDSVTDVPIFTRNDSLPVSIAKVESSVDSSSDGEAGSSVKIVITTPADSLHSDVIRPLANRIAQMKGMEKGQKSFVIRLNDDTLNTDSVKAKFARALGKNEIGIPFSIRVVRDFPESEEGFLPFAPRKRMLVKRLDLKEPDTFSDSLHSDLVGLNPLFKYTASYSGVRAFLVKKIAPEILFSIFLTLTTCAAFGLVHRNMREQQRLVAAKDDFISNVTHELKTPVATVSVALEALKNFSAMDNPQLTREYLDIAQHELARLSEITDRILKTSVLEQPQQNIAFHDVNLSELTETVVSRMRLLADSIGATLEFKSIGGKFTIQGSADHLSNALYNLLDNAIKYRSEHSHIEVTLAEQSDVVSISVKDNGPGIDPTYHAKIFEKFFRVPSGNIHDIKGYGLGLNYVHTVAHLHGGKIQLKSTPGSGSQFVLTFPKAEKHGS